MIVLHIFLLNFLSNCINDHFHCISNSITYLFQVWNYTARSLVDWTQTYGEVNVVAGPIYDYNYDGHGDSDDIIQE